MANSGGDADKTTGNLAQGLIETDASAHFPTEAIQTETIHGDQGICQKQKSPLARAPDNLVSPKSVGEAKTAEEAEFTNSK